MTTMIERMAINLFLHDAINGASGIGDDRCWENSPEFHQAYIGKARSALGAIKADLRAIIFAGVGEEAAQLAEAAITAALEEGE